MSDDLYTNAVRNNNFCSVFSWWEKYMNYNGFIRRSPLPP